MSCTHDHYLDFSNIVVSGTCENDSSDEGAQSETPSNDAWQEAFWSIEHPMPPGPQGSHLPTPPMLEEVPTNPDWLDTGYPNQQEIGRNFGSEACECHAPAGPSTEQQSLKNIMETATQQMRSSPTSPTAQPMGSVANEAQDGGGALPRLGELPDVGMLKYLTLTSYHRGVQEPVNKKVGISSVSPFTLSQHAGLDTQEHFQKRPRSHFDLASINPACCSEDKHEQRPASNDHSESNEVYWKYSGAAGVSGNSMRRLGLGDQPQGISTFGPAVPLQVSQPMSNSPNSSRPQLALRQCTHPDAAVLPRVIEGRQGLPGPPHLCYDTDITNQSSSPPQSSARQDTPQQSTSHTSLPQSSSLTGSAAGPAKPKSKSNRAPKAGQIGGRRPASDPRLDPSIDAKKARRIIANRESAARSYQKKRMSMKVAKAEKDAALHDCYSALSSLGARGSPNAGSIAVSGMQSRTITTSLVFARDAPDVQKLQLAKSTLVNPFPGSRLQSSTSEPQTAPAMSLECRCTSQSHQPEPIRSHATFAALDPFYRRSLPEGPSDHPSGSLETSLRFILPKQEHMPQKMDIQAQYKCQQQPHNRQANHSQRHLMSGGTSLQQRALFSHNIPVDKGDNEAQLCFDRAGSSIMADTDNAYWTLVPHTRDVQPATLVRSWRPVPSVGSERPAQSSFIMQNGMRFPSMPAPVQQGELYPGGGAWWQSHGPMSAPHPGSVVANSNQVIDESVFDELPLIGEDWDMFEFDLDPLMHSSEMGTT